MKFILKSQKEAFSNPRQQDKYVFLVAAAIGSNCSSSTCPCHGLIAFMINLYTSKSAKLRVFLIYYSHQESKQRQIKSLSTLTCTKISIASNPLEVSDRRNWTRSPIVSFVLLLTRLLRWKKISVRPCELLSGLIKPNVSFAHNCWIKPSSRHRVSPLSTGVLDLFSHRQLESAKCCSLKYNQNINAHFENKETKFGA